MPDEVVAPADGGGEEAITDPNAGVTPASQRQADPAVGAAPKDQRPGIADIFAAEKAAGTGDLNDEDDADETPPAAAPAPADAAVTPPSPEDVAKLEGKTPEELDALAKVSKEDLEKVTAAATPEPTDEDKAKAELDNLLETYDDPKVLNAALERAGVDKLGELPAIKALVGRLTQGVRDSTRAEIMKAQATAAQLAEATAEGKAAKGKLVAALDQLANDIDEGKEEGLAIPTAEAIEAAFEEYAGSAVSEYHTKAWNVLSDQMYSLPEMGGQVPEGVKTQPPAFNDAQLQLLDAVKGADPNVWLAAHLAVERDVLWAWAQQEAAANGQGSFENDKVVLQAAHTKEIKDLTKAHEASLKTAREEARAEALADIAAGKVPPKTPKGGKPSTTASSEEEDESVFKGKTPGEIRKIISERQAAGIDV